MTYNIFDCTASAMPKPSKGTEIVKLLLSQASKGMREPLVPMFFLYLAHISVVRNFSILTLHGRKCVVKWPIW